MFDCISLTPGGDIPFNHVPGGSNVLFMDGHVEFIRYAEMGAFPVNGPFAAIVELVGYL
jgi:prepilin-type processing-associated H-X9-DG protein